MNYDLMRMGIKTWLEGETGWAAIYADSNGPAPRSPYLTYQIGTTTRVHDDYMGMPDTDGTAINVGTREVMVSVQAFGTGARQQCENISDSIQKVTVRDQMKGYRSILVDSEPVQNITTLTGTRYEERAGVDVRIRSWSDTTDVPGWIQSVDGTAILVHPNDSTAYDGTWSVSL